MLRNQSQTYSDAVKEYRRRYKLDPPPGFEAWHNYARKHHSHIIDEFDVIYDSISPFWKLSGKEFVESMNKLYNTTQSELWLCEFSGKDARTKCHHPNRTYDRHYSYLFDKLLWNLPGMLPNVKFLINHFDEPRVLVPPHTSSRNSHQDKTFHLTDMSLKPTWDALTGFCAQSQHKAGEAYAEPAVETYGLPFVKNHFSESNLCKHPEYRNLHGSFISPKTFHLIQGLAPVMSTGAFSTMGDIMIPSPAYVEIEFQYNKTRDLLWSQKKDNLYWTGSNTGGYAMNKQWRNYQRQRFVNLAQNLGYQTHSYLRKTDDLISRIKSGFLNSRLFDVAFTRIFQCDSKYCRDQSTHFNVKSWADKDEAFGSKLVFDLDGNGISGRYYKLLASNSLPLKQTLFREWHDERLMPWVHYVPVSQSLEELPELVSYLTSIGAGQKIAGEISQRGRRWMSKAVREVDMTIYTYRLILELARLQDPARKAI
ncbi:hypothetical protein FSARC_3549 [Fusarium sarcochroum]|uniref:Glycosyl transferase CAP10 domain-containing protein n=1 Tax=Fusarium sarcochroum TaxID=1208366 RepID=A0A8H4U485_9HYPO|nr:hypothetical protein FSARC_3549 [Fusarium sarcochroum]